MKREEILSKPVVIVHWKDAANYMNNVGDPETTVVLMQNTTVGWKVYQDDEITIIAYSVSTIGENDFYAIPTANIISENPLKF